MDRLIEVAGTQSLRRLLNLLKIVSLHNIPGVTVAELSRYSGISRATVSRMVSCMLTEGFLERNAKTGLFHLGHEAISIGISAFSAVPLVDRYRLTMTRLARRSGGVVFLLYRQADFAVCLHQEAYEQVVPSSRMKPGERRLLGIGGAGIALLAKLPDEEIEEIFSRNSHAYSKIGMTRQKLFDRVNQTRSVGYGIVINSVTEGAAGVGVAFPGFTYPWAAISIGTHVAQFTADCQAEMAGLLHAELANLRKYTRGTTP